MNVLVHVNARIVPKLPTRFHDEPRNIGFSASMLVYRSVEWITSMTLLHPILDRGEPSIRTEHLPRDPRAVIGEQQCCQRSDISWFS